MRTATLLAVMALGWTLVAQPGLATANDNPFRTAQYSTAAQVTFAPAIQTAANAATPTQVRYRYYGGYRGYAGYRPYYRAYRPYVANGYGPYSGAYNAPGGYPSGPFTFGYGGYGYSPRVYGSYYRGGYRRW